jgi:hypothetical protein
VLPGSLGAAGLVSDIEVSFRPPRSGDVRAYYNDRFLPALRAHVYGCLRDYAGRASSLSSKAAQLPPNAQPPPAQQQLFGSLGRAPLQVLAGNAAAAHAAEAAGKAALTLATTPGAAAGGRASSCTAFSEQENQPPSAAAAAKPGLGKGGMRQQPGGAPQGCVPPVGGTSGVKPTWRYR